MPDDEGLLQLLRDVQTGTPRTIDELRRDFEAGPEDFDAALAVARERWLIKGVRVGARGYAVALMPAGRSLVSAASGSKAS